MKKVNSLVLLGVLSIASLNAGKIHKEASNGNIDAVAALVKEGVDINTKTTSGKTPGLTALSFAALKGHVGLMLYLCQNGAEVNTAAEGDDNRTPLLYAVNACSAKSVTVLLVYEADPNAVDSKGYNALHYALWKRKLSLTNKAAWNEIITVLKEAGAVEGDAQEPESV